MTSNDDTIAAISTPIGSAGIGIVRISGPRSVELAQKIFKGKRTGEELRSHRLYLGHLFDPRSGRTIDEVLLSYMKAPHSYTREDVVEINSHSGYLLLSKILQVVLDQGARLAKPGEFTLRAFLNGRIDLTQAEAVMDLINSKSERGLHLASQQMKGALRDEIETIRQKVMEILAHVEVAIDFPEEEAGTLPGREIARRLEQEVIRPIEDIVSAHAAKRIWVDGVSTVIVGRVNAGKSSLLNRLLDEERAIVTPIPGTTRDVIESTLTIGGVPFRLMDTAGFREAKHEVERIGLSFTEQKLAKADLVLVVIDQSRPLNEDDCRVVRQSRGKKTLMVINKIDLPCRMGEERPEILSDFPAVRISALTGEGMEHLRKAVLDEVLGGDVDMTSTHIVPNLRHKNALRHAAECFERAARNLTGDEPVEVVAFELRSGLDHLGEIIGETTEEQLLDQIFGRFCLGK